jgi:hypothetical protein
LRLGNRPQEREISAVGARRRSRWLWTKFQRLPDRLTPKLIAEEAQPGHDGDG